MSDYILEAKGITKRFGGVIALRDVDVRQRRGETLGMIGPNGSGKSTFVNVLSGHLKFNGGTMLLEGSPLAGKKPFEVAAAGLARTYQAVRVFGALSVRANIETALVDADKPVSRERMAELADWLAIAHRMDALAGSLKLDEQRRLELMMRLVQNPKLLMLDEPAGGLSATEVAAMIRLLRELKSTCSLFVIEHSMRVIRELADNVVVLMSGEKLVEGPPGDILKDRRVIEHYLGAADV